MKLVFVVIAIVAGHCVEPSWLFGQNTSADADAESDSNERPQLRIGRVPELPRPAPAEPTEDEIREIRKLVDGLVNIDDLSFTATFLPTAIDLRSPYRPRTEPAPQLPPDLTKLVAFGPRALPFLIEGLDNDAATKVVFRSPKNWGMLFDEQFPTNPANDRERRILGTTPSRSSRDDAITEYTVKVGDVCFVAIGQIVGRAYYVQHSRQRTAFIVSPTHNAEVRRKLRELWSSPNSAELLFDSLIHDYVTEGNGDELYGWYTATGIQANAAMRLLYYFPRESAETIARRLDDLDVSAIHPEYELSAIAERAKANRGVLADQFVTATAWSEQPDVKRALLDVFNRSTNRNVIVACLRSVGPDHPAKVRARLIPLIESLPPDDNDPFGIDPHGPDYQLLVGLGQYTGDGAKPVFRTYLEQSSVLRCVTMCYVLRTTRKEWAIELLAPRLDDRRTIEDWYYSVDGNNGQERLPIRICDEAAKTIALADQNLSFALKGAHAELDRQITAIKQKIAR